MKSILHTAFQPPELHERFFWRERCLKQLEEARDKRLIFIRAGAGFGKTSLMALFYERLSEPKLWFSVPEAYFTCEKLMIHLFYGLMQKLEVEVRGKWEPTWQRVAIGAVPMDQMVTNLINLIEEVPEEVYLFLDDFQFLELRDREADLQALQMLSRFASQNLHFVISSREELPIPVNRFRLESRLLELEEDDLTFDRDEMMHFLEQNGIRPDEQSFGVLYQKTEGWIAGVCLILYFYGDKLQGMEEYQAISTVREYLAEILAGIGEEIRDFLRKTCVFELLPIDICNDYLGREDCQRILDELVESRLLTYRYIEDGVHYYRYHNLLREFFLQQLSEEEKKENYRALAEVYSQREQPEMVIAYMIKAEEDQKAIELIKKQAPRAFISTDLNLLNDWLEYMAQKEAGQDPVLDLYRGQMRELQGQLDAAQSFYLKAEPGLKAAGDNINWVRVRTQIAGIYWWRKDFAQTIQICEETLPYLPEEEKRTQAGLYNLMGTSSIALKERNQGIRYLTKAKELTHESNDVDGECWILNNLAFNGYLPQGKIAEAISAYEEALINFRRVKNKQGMALVMTNLGYVYLGMRELEKAEELFREAEELYLEMNNLRSIRSLWILSVRMETIRGNLNRAEELLMKIEKGLLPDDTHTFLGLFAAAYAMYKLANGDNAQAEEWMQRASEHMDKTKDDSPLVQDLLLQRVAFYLQTGQFAKTIELAERLLQEVRGEGVDLVKVEASLLLAMAQKEEFGEVARELRTVVNGLSKGPYAFLEKKYADLIHLLGKIMPNQQGSKIEVTAKAQSMQISFFGKFMINNQGNVSMMEDWSNRKALDLLKYLIIHHDQWVQQDTILEYFWPATDAEKAKQTLYVALYTIRKKWDSDPERSKEAIQTRKGMYRIQLPEPYWIDTEAFSDYATEGLRLYRERAFLKAEDFLMQAKRLYRGNFLEENMYDEWTQDYREQYMGLYLNILLALAQIRGTGGQHGEAIELLAQVLEKNQFHDQAHQEIMQHMVAAGRGNEAIQHYREYSGIYREELGVDMPSVVRRIYQQVVAGKAANHK